MLMLSLIHCFTLSLNAFTLFAILMLTGRLFQDSVALGTNDWLMSSCLTISRPRIPPPAARRVLYENSRQSFWCRYTGLLSDLILYTKRRLWYSTSCFIDNQPHWLRQRAWSWFLAFREKWQNDTACGLIPVSYTHLTLPTNREV